MFSRRKFMALAPAAFVTPVLDIPVPVPSAEWVTVGESFMTYDALRTFQHDLEQTLLFGSAAENPIVEFLYKPNDAYSTLRLIARSTEVDDEYDRSEC